MDSLVFLIVLFCAIVALMAYDVGDEPAPLWYKVAAWFVCIFGSWAMLGALGWSVLRAIGR